MRTVAQFYQDCLRSGSQQPPLDVQLSDAAGCVLAEDVRAPFDLPFTDVAACDGYALRAADLQDLAADAADPEDPVALPVTGEVRSGELETAVLIPGAAIRIAAGAPLPSGADAVVPVEDTDRGVAEVRIGARLRPGANVRSRGEDVSTGQVVLRAGTRVGARQIALLAGVGRARVVVHPRPRVVVLSIGDDLVEPGREALAGTVFDANGFALSAAVEDAGAQTFRVPPVRDSRRGLRDTIEDQLVRADLIITTGGTSSSTGDTLREVLAELGTVRFDNVAASPGSFLGVGTLGDGIPIYCLPGDPVAAQVCFEVYVRPALREMQGWQRVNRPSVQARVDRGWASPAGKREFVRVRLVGDPQGGYTAHVQGEPDALWLSALAESNALATVPESTETVRAGDMLACLVLE